ncbi:hypothetical protein MASR2M48_34410 [Spirochaetota bacterium]
MESAKDRSAAAAALRRGLERYPADLDMMLYAAEVFWEGNATEDEAIALAQGSALKPDSTRALKVLLAADLASGAYTAAASHADAIIATGGSYADTESLYRAYRGSGHCLRPPGWPRVACP